jgi:cell pole-organizing protein PopZ
MNTFRLEPRLTFRDHARRLMFAGAFALGIAQSSTSRRPAEQQTGVAFAAPLAEVPASLRAAAALPQGVAVRAPVRARQQPQPRTRTASPTAPTVAQASEPTATAAPAPVITPAPVVVAKPAPSAPAPAPVVAKPAPAPTPAHTGGGSGHSKPSSSGGESFESSG